jgi:hypothetical protein
MKIHEITQEEMLWICGAKAKNRGGEPVTNGNGVNPAPRNGADKLGVACAC